MATSKNPLLVQRVFCWIFSAPEERQRRLSLAWSGGCVADPIIAHASAASTVSTPETSATAQAFRFTVDISIAVAMTRWPSVAFPLRTSPLSKGGHGWVGGTMSAMDGAT